MKKEPFAFTFCDKNFQAKQHEMLHTGEKPYACSVCEKKIRKENTSKYMKRTFSL